MAQVQANGITIEYDTFGDPGAPTILLIMGFAGQMTMWPESLCQGLAARGFRVVRFDNRDVGKSTHLAHLGVPDIGALIAAAMAGQPGTAPYALTDMAADAIGLLDALGIADAYVVGASMGGMIAQLCAIDHADRVRGLVSIMSTTGRPGLPPGKPEATAVLMARPDSDARADRIAMAIKAWRVIGSPLYPASDAEIEATAAREVDRVPFDPAGLARQLAAIVTAPPRHERLAGVRAPALVLHGADDPLILVDAAHDTAAAIPGAELQIVPGMGHDFTEALAKAVFLPRIGDFVARAEGRA